MLQSEKANVVQRIAEGATSIYPAGLVMGILTGTESTKLQVAAGDYNAMIDNRIDEIERDLRHPVATTNAGRSSPRPGAFTPRSSTPSEDRPLRPRALPVPPPLRNNGTRFNSAMSPSDPSRSPQTPMHLDLTAEQHSLRKQLRTYYRDLFTPELRAALNAEWDDMGGSVFRQVVARMGADGWLGIGWPKEYGGQGRGPLEQFIFWEETYRARAPLPIIAVNTIGPTVIRYGTEEQKQLLLPGIVRGELHFGVGYTEPGAGTDLASLTTRAVRDGDDWVINGQKIYTTHAHDADYIWLAARTDPDAPKHKGITIILVPTSSPGFSVTPIHTLGGERTNATYYEDVRVPVANTIGPENGGWTLITSQLNHERITLATPGVADRALDEVWAWAAKTKRADGPHHRRAVGAAEPRALLREARRAEAAELALGVVARSGSPTWPRRRP